MITVTQYPEGWNAVHSPIEVGVQRKDYAVSHVGADSNYPDYSVVYLTSVISDITGKTIYINSDNYVGSFEVKIFSHVGIYYMLWIDTPYTSNTVGGYIVSDDLALNYCVDCAIYTGSTLIATLTCGTFTDGKATFDLQEVLKSQIPQFDTTALSGTAVISECYKFFNVKIRERYTGYTGSYSTPYYFYGINAVKQNGDANGCRMTGYEADYDTRSSPFVITKGKFLQEFSQPVLNINEDFELQFIWWGGSMQFFPLTAKFEFQDINKTAISTTSVLVGVQNAGRLVRLNLSDLTIPDSACYIKAWIEVGDTRQRYLKQGYVREGYIF